MTTHDPKDPIIDFLKKDYELKINYLTAHLTRMWQRFNFFIALESALSVALFGLFKEKEEVLSHYATPIALIGICSSICWYILGAQDRYLVVLYREHVEDVGKKIADQIGLMGYVHVGDQNTKPKRKRYEHIYQWRSDYISTTRFAALFPVLVVLYWISIFMLKFK
jgi:hypothetical protein